MSKWKFYLSLRNCMIHSKFGPNSRGGKWNISDKSREINDVTMTTRWCDFWAHISTLKIHFSYTKRISKRPLGWWKNRKPCWRLIYLKKQIFTIVDFNTGYCFPRIIAGSDSVPHYTFIRSSNTCIVLGSARWNTSHSQISILRECHLEFISPSVPQWGFVPHTMAGGACPGWSCSDNASTPLELDDCMVDQMARCSLFRPLRKTWSQDAASKWLNVPPAREAARSRATFYIRNSIIARFEKG